MTLCRLRKIVALAVVVCLVNGSSPGMIALAAEAAAQGQPQAWKAYLTAFSAPSQIPFAKPFGLDLGVSGRLDGLMRVLERTDLQPDAFAAGLPAARQAEMVSAAVGRYAAGLAARGEALGAADQRALAEVDREFADLAGLAALVPKAQRETLRGGHARVAASLAQTRSEAVTQAVERVAAAWDDKPADAAAAAAGPAALDPAWRLQKAAGPSAGRADVAAARTAVAPWKPAAAAQPGGLRLAASRILDRGARMWRRLRTGAQPVAQAPADVQGASEARAQAPLKLEEGLSSETAAQLRILGLDYAQFQRLAQAQFDFERQLLEAQPALKQAIFSMRAHERFSETVLSATKQLRNEGVEEPLAKALLLAMQSVYGDLLPDSSLWNLKEPDGQARVAWEKLKWKENAALARVDLFNRQIEAGEVESLRTKKWLEAGHPFVSNGDNILKMYRALAASVKGLAEANEDLAAVRRELARRRAAAVRPFQEFMPEKIWRAARSEAHARNGIDGHVARALRMPFPVLFKEPAGADAELMRALRGEAASLGAELSVLWSHPFTEERQLVGHQVPQAGEDRLVFGFGELMRQVRAAENETKLAQKKGRAPRKFLLLIKNIEAMDPGVRTTLQEALRNIRELTHPELGTVRIPANLQFLFTIREGANLEDDSFYDRVMVKTLPAGADFKAPQALAWPQNATPDNYLKQVSIRRKKGRPFLVLPGAEIALSDEFASIADSDLHDAIYLKTGLVLDFDTVRMLAAMAQARQNGRPLLRIEGPTGLGKTFTAQGYARLRGYPFFANPINSDTELSEWIGGFEQDKHGLFAFHGDTPFKRRLEEGGVVAVSELNTLLDHHEKASLAWWLAQIAETQPDADGYRTIRLTEVPVAEGQPVPQIRIHPETLIVVDTNPEGDYSARGGMPEVFKDQVPVISLEPLMTGFHQKEERAKLEFFADRFLKHDWTSHGVTLAAGIKDPARRARLAGLLAHAYWRAGVKAAMNGGEIDGRVLSVRELKRMAQDALFALARGADERAAVDQAAADQLVAAVQDPLQRQAAVETWAGSRPPRDFAAFIHEHLIAKKRPVHARVSPDTDVREELLRLLAQEPGIDLSVISATDETDRFQMEGGLVASEKAEGLEFGAGMFGRLIEKARRQPDKKVLFVFDNAHNLRPDQIVALNEFLQEGRLYPKGQAGELFLPPNAHVLFISRTDSPLRWSPAERSRFVEFAHRADASELEAPLQSVSEPSRSLADGINAWLARAFARDAGAFSHAHRRRLDGAVAQAVNEAVQDAADPTALLWKLQEIAEDLILMALPADQREKAREPLLSELKNYWELAVFAPRAGQAPLKTLLLPAKQALLQAASPAQRQAAASEIKRLLEDSGSELAWKTASTGDIEDLDIIRALVSRELLDLDRAEAVAMTPDARYILAGEGSELYMFHKTQAGSYHRTWQGASPGDIASLQISADGKTLLKMGADGLTVIFKGGPDRYEAVWQERHASGSFVKLAADGQKIYRRISGGIEVLVWDEKKHQFQFLENIVVRLGTSIDITADGKKIPDIHPDTGTLRIHRRDVLMMEQDIKSQGSTVKIFADGAIVAVSGSGVALFRFRDGIAYEAHFAEDVDGDSLLDFSSDGRTVAVGKGNKLRLFEWNGVQYEKAAEGTAVDGLKSLALSADGRRIVIIGENTRPQVLAFETLLTQKGIRWQSLGAAEDTGSILGPQVRIAQSLTDPWEETVNRVRLQLSLETDGSGKEKLRQELLGLLAAHPESWSWEEKPAEELSALDVVFLADSGQRQSEVEVSNPSWGTVKPAVAAAVAGFNSSNPSITLVLFPQKTLLGQSPPKPKKGSGIKAWISWIAYWIAKILGSVAPYRMAGGFVSAEILPERLMFMSQSSPLPFVVRPPMRRNTIFGGNRPASSGSKPGFLMVEDGESLLRLEDGKKMARRQLPGMVKVLKLPARPVVLASFKPRYGNKPFYFAADDQGKVFINFNGLWLATRHRLLAPEALAGEFSESASVQGQRKSLRPVELRQVRHPYSQDERPLLPSDFLYETPVLAEVERSLLQAFAAGSTVNLVGQPGAGKTSISLEAALLLGLPRFKFQMHGERELADLIGSYREDASGRMRLTAKPERDGAGRPRFRLPLLDLLANGGVFVLDEGAIGERGRELLSWFSAIASGDKELVLQEFPGHEIRIPVHPDFHLAITNNDPAQTAGRQQLKSEISSNAQLIYVDEDESSETLENIFVHFLGPDSPMDRDKAHVWGKTVSRFHQELKSTIGTQIGKDNKDRYYLSKREVRRVAAYVGNALKQKEYDGKDLLREALRVVYEAMFSHARERRFVRDRIHALLGPVGSRFDMRAKVDFPSAATGHEAVVSALTRRLLSQGEPVLYLTERGARGADMVRAAAESLSATITVIDAAPEHGELELLGGLLPNIGSPSSGARSRQVRGMLTRSLLTADQMRALSDSAAKPRASMLWIRNIDLWKEEIRTALNGLLEDGYIDLEGQDGRTQRLYKPPHLHLLAEMPQESTAEFSSAFFNRWVKIGVSRDSVPSKPDEPAEFESVLRSRYQLEDLEIHYIKELYAALTKMDQERGWSNRRDHQWGPTIFYALAQALRQSKREDPRGQALSDQAARRKFIGENFAREATRLLGSRLPSEAAHTDISDAARFEKVLKVILGAPQLPVFGQSIETSDGTLDSPLKAVGGVPVRLTDRALSVLAACRKNGVRLTSQLLGPLGVLARADNLGKVTAFVAETGAVKTSLAALWAALTGRRFYKYQSHAGSEISDLTIDIEQDQAGEFKKRVKEFYRVLREGHVVVDIDEANVSPWILWALEPLLRGERWVQPIFPEEEPFAIGEGVQVILTFNPERYAGRNKIDPRLMEPMIVSWLGSPAPEEAARVIESFYGVWEEPRPQAERREGGAALEESAAVPAPTFAAAGLSARAKADRRMKKGMETFDPNEDVSAAPAPLDGPREKARGIFAPELYPHTRQSAYDRYDAAREEWVRDGNQLQPIETPAGAARELGQTHDGFTGRLQMDLSPQWRILPSAGADMTFLEIEAYDAQGAALQAPLELAKDSADNYFIRTKAAVSAEIRYRVAVPAQYYGHPVPAGLSFRYPGQIPEEVREAMGLIGLKGEETDLRQVLYRLIEYFRDFSLAENGIADTGGSVYLDLVRSKAGVCRHRTFAFARTLLGLGMAVRYVESDIHAYAEVQIPELGWLRVDLGGGGDPAHMDLSPLANERHAARRAADFPQPETYRENGEKFSKRMEQALAQQGIKPQQAGGGRPGAAGDLAREGQRIRRELEALGEELAADAKVHDELSELFASGRGDTEFVFRRMLRALQDRVRITKKKVKRGLEIDPVAFMLRKPKQFVRRKQEEKLQTTAVAVLLDFSGSMGSVKRQLAYTIAATGENFHKLREIAPQNFFYDLSWFTDGPKAQTVVAMNERLSQKENAGRLVTMANSAGSGGTAMLPALKEKLKDFLASREARGAKVKYLVLFTDGADSGAVSKVGDRYELTPAMASLMSQYRQAGIDIIAIGIGPGAEHVRAFNGPGQHFVRVGVTRSEDIAETIAKVAELKSRGSGRLPDGELNALLQIEAPQARSERWQ